MRCNGTTEAMLISGLSGIISSASTSHAFLRLVKSHHLHADECEDGVQDVWLTLVGKLTSSQLDPGRGEFGDWLRTGRGTQADRLPEMPQEAPVRDT